MVFGNNVSIALLDAWYHGFDYNATPGSRAPIVSNRSRNSRRNAAISEATRLESGILFAFQRGTVGVA